MKKKGIWKIGCAVFLALLTCTVLSVRIEKLMRNEVQVTKGKVQKEEGIMTVSLPKGSVWEQDGEQKVYCLKKEQGIWGNILRVKEESVILIREEENADVILDENARGSEGTRDVIYYVAHPVQAEDIVEVSTESTEPEMLRERMKKQVPLLVLVLIIILDYIAGMVEVWKCFQERHWKRILTGVLLLAVCVSVLWGVTGLLDIPREYLPEEQIFDVGYYLGSR